MSKAYTIIESTQDDAITVSDDKSQATIALLEYTEEQYQNFLQALETWQLLLIDDSYEENGIETGDYNLIDAACKKRYSLQSQNLLIKDDAVVGFVLGKNHYSGWKTTDKTVLMFLDGTAIGKTKYEHSYVYGDYPSDTTYYHDCYIYKLVKKNPATPQ